MLELLDGPAKAAVAIAAYAGLREGETRGLRWEDYAPAPDEDSLGTLQVRRSFWRRHPNKPKTKKSESPVPTIGPLAAILDTYRRSMGNPADGWIFPGRQGRPLSLDALYRRHIMDVFEKAEVMWHGWHGFRRGLATTLNRLGIDDSVIQGILRHSTVQVTQRCYIKTISADSVLAMKKLETCSQLVLENGPKTAPEPQTVVQ
jgi:integrase